MSYEVITAPATEPIVAADFRDFYLNEFDSTRESGIDEMVSAVRSYIERQFDKAIITQTVREKYCYWKKCLELTVSPVASIDSIKYYDDTDTLRTLSSDKYELSVSRISGYVFFNDDMDFPTLSTSRPEPIQIEYIAGEAEAPAHIKQHIKSCVARIYFNRESFASIMSNMELFLPETRIRV